MTSSVFSFLVIALFLSTRSNGQPFSLSENSEDQRIFLYRFFRYFGNVSSELSGECLEVMNLFWADRNKEEWASKMIDSNAVLESGLASGNIQFLGQFDECLSLKVPNSAFGAQYCSVRFPLLMLPFIGGSSRNGNSSSSKFPPIVVQISPPLAGICIPAACGKDTDLKIILGKYSELTNSSVEVVHCTTEERNRLVNRFQPAHVVILTIFIFLFLICTTGTVIDHFLESNRRFAGKLHFLFHLLLCFSFRQNLNTLFKTSKNTSSALSSSNQASISSSLIHSQLTSSKLNELAASSTSLNSTATTTSSLSSNSSSSSPHLEIENNQHYLTVPQLFGGRNRTSSSSSSSSSPAVATLEVNTGKVETPKNSFCKTRPEIGCLHGIRFISFFFILIYHTFTEAQTPSANLLTVLDAERHFELQLITNAALWVDTFFLLSGFLVAHSALYPPYKDSKYSETIWRHISGHPRRILHRYLRLTPSIAGLVALSILIEPLGSGPLWAQSYIATSKGTCHQNWWTVLLYVGNLFKLNQAGSSPTECLSYLWYLAVDMQFFLVSPLLVMCLTSKQRRTQIFGVCINLGVIFASWAITAVLMAGGGLTPTILVTVYDLSYINRIYKAAYCRIGPYCVGVLLAYHLFRQRSQTLLEDSESLESNSLLLQQSRSSKFKRIFSGLASLILSATLILGVTLLTYPWLQGASYQNAPAYLYGVTHRTVWAAGWALLIANLVSGQTPLTFIKRVLECGPAQVLSRLTYQSYLVHSVLISAVTCSVRQKMYFSDANFVFDVLKYLLLTEGVSVGTYLLFERPFINLETTFLSSK